MPHENIIPTRKPSGEFSTNVMNKKYWFLPSACLTLSLFLFAFFVPKYETSLIILYLWNSWRYEQYLHRFWKNWCKLGNTINPYSKQNHVIR